MTQPVFAFGTLMDADVRTVVFGSRGGDMETEAATLAGFTCARLADESYPVLVPDAGGAVTGLVLFGLDAEDMSRLRFFESEEYEFERCRIATASGRQVEAMYCSEGTTAGAAEAWTLAWWQQHHKQAFLAMARPYMDLFGKAEVEQAERLWEQMQQRE